MALDPTTDIGKLRLRVGDYFDLPIFPDSVYESALDETDDNLPRAAKLMATYILGSLTMRVHEKLAQVEIYGNQFVDNYVKFLKSTVLNPNMMDVSPLPYLGEGIDDTHPIVQFQQDWNNCYSSGTDAAQLSFLAGL